MFMEDIGTLRMTLLYTSLSYDLNKTSDCKYGGLMFLQIILSKISQPPKKPSPIYVTFFGMTKFVSLSHPENAADPILVSDSGKLILDKC